MSTIYSISTLIVAILIVTFLLPKSLGCLTQILVIIAIVWMLDIPSVKQQVMRLPSRVVNVAIESTGETVSSKAKALVNEKIIDYGCNEAGISLGCNVAKNVATNVQSVASDIEAAKLMCPKLPVVRKLFPEHEERYAFCNPVSATFKDTKDTLDAIRDGTVQALAKEFITFYSADPNVLQSYDNCLQAAAGTMVTGCSDPTWHFTRQEWRICMEISLRAAAGSSGLFSCRKAAH